MIPPSKQRDEETLKVVRHLFTRMAKEEGTPPQKLVEYLPEYFLKWVEDNVDPMSKYDVLQEARAEEVGWDFLQEILHNATGALMIAPMWSMVTLSYRDNPSHKLRRLHTILLLTWEDGRIMPLSVQIPSDMMQGGVMNDAFVATQLVQSLKHFQTNVVQHGLDGLHDRFAEDFGGTRPFEVLMGAFLSILPQLDSSLHDHMKKYVRLFQAIVEPPIPPHVRAQVAALARQRRPEPPAAERESPRGGFDD